MARVHDEYMPRSRNDCGYCRYLNLRDEKGTKAYCELHRYYCQLYESCRKQEYTNRSLSELEKFCKWHVSTMLGLVLNMDLDSKPFTSIRTLKEYASQDEKLNEAVKLYDAYGEWISTGLYFDLEKEQVASSLMPILYKVSDLVDKNMMNEAFNEYSKLVMLLYNRYVHTLNYNSPSQNKVKIK